MQMFPEDPANLWAACDGQEDRKCAERCYARYFSGAPEEREADVAYWTGWVARRMRHVREMAELVDIFIAPARYLLDRFRDEFGLPAQQARLPRLRLRRERLAGRRRAAGEPFTFGYIGTHIPAKGIHHLLRAFGRAPRRRAAAHLGAARGQDTRRLKASGCGAARRRRRPRGVAARVQEPGHRPRRLRSCRRDRRPIRLGRRTRRWSSTRRSRRAFPSSRPNAGGMAEYVRHEVNGLLFEHRSVRRRWRADAAVRRRSGARAVAWVPAATSTARSGDVPAIEEPRSRDRAALRGRSAAARLRAGRASPTDRGGSRSTPTRTRATCAA